MAPVPVYSASPINASKASGPSPQTARPDGASETTAAAPVPTSTATADQYAPQPAAVPSLPVQTAAPQPQSGGSIQPTPTQPMPSHSGVPPAPQPGAGIPPPPKAGETLQTSSQPAAPRTSYPAPAEPSYHPASGPPPGPSLGAADTQAHPPGYQQNANAPFHSMHDQGPVDDDDDSVWGTAKKWASAAGNTLAEAESEVWKRFTK